MDFNSRQQELIDFAKYVLRPKPKLTGTEFANSNFFLSPESSSEPGRIKIHPYQEEILNAMTDQLTEKVTIQKSARVGYSIMLNITTAYFITQDPCSILFAQPTDDEAYGYATDSIEPMIRDNPDVSEAISTKPIRGKAKKEKTVKKLYPGGILEIVGSHSPKNFRRRTVRVAIGDEIDGWEIGAGDEGDQLKLLERRTNDFFNRKIITGSTPTTKAKTRIVKEYLKGDRRKRYLPCPFCKEYHTLEFENLKYDLDEYGDVIDETVGFACPKCGGIYDQSYHKEMDINGKWIAERPFKGHATFFVWSAYSYSAKSTWIHIAKEFEDAKKDETILMQPFHNTVLGHDYDDKAQLVTSSDLIAKKENYGGYDVPENVRVLIMSVDTQDDRLEWDIIGYGEGMQGWKVQRGKIFGDPSQEEVWNTLEDIFDNNIYDHPKGKMKIYAMGIDSGGSKTAEVYEFCNPRLYKRIYALKGANSISAPEVSKQMHKDVKHKYYGKTYFMVGVNMIKDIIWSGIQMEKPGRRYIHFPNTEDFDEEYFSQLTSEYREKNGAWKIRIRGTRNEAFDLCVYQYATFKIAGIKMDHLVKMDAYLFGIQAKIKKKKKIIELSSGI